MTQQQLKDRFGRVHDYLRLSVTDKCNLRCVYCMPEEGLPFFPDDTVLSQSEILRLVANFAKMGITKIRLTGGEPLLRKDICEIVAGISAIPEIEDIAITTNGLALKRLAVPLKKAGLKRLNISMDTFDADSYRKLTRGGSLKRLLAGIEAAADAGFEKIKLNVVVIHGQNEHELIDFLRYSLDYPVNIRFIEFMPIGKRNNENWRKGYKGIEEVFAICQEQGWDYQPVTLNGNGPSKNYQINGAKGTFGLIHPIGCRFCESCNRLRITADGYLKACLYWDDEIHLKPYIEDFEKFQEKVQFSLNQKPENHEMALTQSETKTSEKPTWRHMSQIGG